MLRNKMSTMSIFLLAFLFTGIPGYHLDSFELVPARRYEFNFDPNDVSTIIGAPSLPSHLPEALPVLPGHTLIRPTLGMLKSSIKFPHRDLEDGSGVYGNINNLGLRYDGRNERVLYSGFRRSGDGAIDVDDESQEVPDVFQFMPFKSRRTLGDYIMVVPSREKQRKKQRFSLTNLVLDLENQRKEADSKILDRLYEMQKMQKMQKPRIRAKKLIFYIADPEMSSSREDSSRKFLFKRGVKRNLLKKLNLKNGSDSKQKGKQKKRLKEAQESDDGDEDDDSPDIVTKPPKVDESEIDTKSKLEQFLQLKNQFNVIKISEHALDFDDFLKNADEDEIIRLHKRNWWFYNQIDWAPFDGKEEV